MSEEEKVLTPEQETEEAAVAPSSGQPSPKKRNKKLPVVIGVVVAILVVAGAGFYVWHEQPSFCNAICHTPMDAYLPTYEASLNQEATDKWGNTVTTANAMLAPVHREADKTCLDCHVPTLGEQVSEGISWVSGNYEVYTTQTGMQVVSERSLSDLVAARGVDADEFCLNEACHNMTRDDLIQATASLSDTYNPHVSQHKELECSDCHKAHRASTNACTQCHNEAPVPDGWVTYSESANLVKELES
jgi:hypothetical protein